MKNTNYEAALVACKKTWDAYQKALDDLSRGLIEEAACETARKASESAQSNEAIVSIMKQCGHNE